MTGMLGRHHKEESKRKTSQILTGRTLCVDCHKTTDTWGYKTIQKRSILNKK